MPLLPTTALDMNAARIHVLARMRGESVTVIDNVAEAVLRRSRAATVPERMRDFVQRLAKMLTYEEAVLDDTTEGGPPPEDGRDDTIDAIIEEARELEAEDADAFWTRHSRDGGEA
jgi:hypothetical protein